jgi:opacity protein-like surface antigen
MKSKLRLLAASLLASAVCGTAFAQLDNFYAEGIVGFSSFKLTTGDFTNNAFTQQSPATGTTPNTITITGTDKSDTAYGLRIGYQLNETFGVEGSYVNLGTAKVSGTAQLNTPVLSASAVTWSTDLDVTKWTFGFTARHSLQDKLSIVGRAGIGSSTAEWSKTITTVTIPPNNSAATAGRILQDAFRAQQRKVDFDYGIGLAYKVNEHSGLNLGYDYVSGKQAASVISLSYKYSF